MTKRPLSDLFTNLEVVGHDDLGDVIVLHCESKDSADTLSIQVRIPTSEVGNYDLGKFGPK